jgi:alpha-tubulin suppressor-like RCC1 family protein
MYHRPMAGARLRSVLFTGHSLAGFGVVAALLSLCGASPASAASLAGLPSVDVLASAARAPASVAKADSGGAGSADPAGPGAVFAWGSGSNGQLGDGGTTETDVPVPVSGLSEASAVAGGYAFGLALLHGGAVAAWGDGESGLLGDGSVQSSDEPVHVSGLTEASAIAAGWYHSLALLEDGDVVAWGYNGFGELGNGERDGPESCPGACSKVPVAVLGLSEVSAVAAGASDSFALLSDGHVMAWGGGGNELGIGGEQESDVPVEVPGLSEVVAISAGYSTTLALLGSGKVMAWGFNAYGQLGNGTTSSSDVPVEVSGLSEVVAISAGVDHDLALLRNGTVMAWGDNEYGELGNGTTTGPETCVNAYDEKVGCSRTPVPVNGAREVSQIAAGSEFSLALLNDGTVLAWGENERGELGDRSTSGSDVPVEVVSLRGASAISAGSWYEGLAIAQAAAAPPSITKIEPAYGSPAGGTSVTITGERLGDATGVLFGSAQAERFTVESETQITAVAPPGSGIVDVGVEAPGGLISATSAADEFSYAPAVSKLEPKQGPQEGGTEVSITGTNLTGASEVKFGESDAGSFTVRSDTQITAVAPPGKGKVTVAVRTAGGTSPAVSADRYKYLPPTSAPLLTWVSPVRADDTPPFESPTAVSGVSCPTSGLCVAVDRSGDVLSSTDPTGGTAAWARADVLGYGFAGVSCPSSELCVAVGAGDIATTDDPAGGASAWSVTSVIPPLRGGGLAAVSCASISLCVAVDGHGDVWSSADPTGGAGAWSETHLENAEFSGVSCPSAKLCVVVPYGSGSVWISTDPTGGASAWSQTRIDAHSLFDVSCSSDELCVATDNYGNVIVSTDPTDGEGAWTPDHVAKGLITSISCASWGLCVALEGHEAIISSEPAAGQGAWASTSIETVNRFGGHEGLEAASCPEANLCVLTDSGSGVITATEPAGGPGAWTITHAEVGENAFTGVSCASLQLCVGVDGAGNVAASSDPSGGAGAWRGAHIGEHALSGVSCPSARLCIAVDEAGDVLSSTDPTGGASAWILADVDGSTPLTGVSCASVRLCVAIDANGNAIVSAEPAGGASAWSVTSVADYELRGVSCPSESLCVVMARGNAITSTDPTGGADAWKSTYVGVPAHISCPSTQLCVTTGLLEYSVFSTTEPLGGESAWSETFLGGEEEEFPLFNGFDEVGCGPQPLCVATTLGSNGSPGNVMVSDNPTAGAEAWSEENVYNVPIERPSLFFELYSRELTGVSCVAEGMCAVVDDRGRIMIGSTSSTTTTTSSTTTSSSATATATATTATLSTSAASPQPPILTRLRQSHRRWRERRARGRDRAGTPVGTTFSFHLSEPATVRLAFTRPLRGRLLGGRCEAPSRSNRAYRRCTLSVIAGTLSVSGHPGANTVTFAGRLSSGRRLPPGRYMLSATATNSAGRSAPRLLAFAILGG